MGRWLTWTGCALVALTCASSDAQTARQSSSGSQALQQLQQLASERTALQAENARLKSELETAKKEAERSKKDADSLRGRMSASESAAARARDASQTNEKTLESTRARLDELVARFRETGETLRGVESDRARLQNELATRNREFDTCATNNDELYRLGIEVLDRYEGAGVFQRAARSEPFTRVARNRLENLVDEYRARAEELRVKARTEAQQRDASRPQAK